LRLRLAWIRVGMAETAYLTPQQAADPFQVSAKTGVLGLARRTAYYIARSRPGNRYQRRDDGRSSAPGSTTTTPVRRIPRWASGAPASIVPGR
jgi:hypothetical protein